MKDRSWRTFTLVSSWQHSRWFASDCGMRTASTGAEPARIARPSRPKGVMRPVSTQRTVADPAPSGTWSLTGRASRSPSGANVYDSKPLEDLPDTNPRYPASAAGHAADPISCTPTSLRLSPIYNLVIVTLLAHQTDAVLPALQRSAAKCIQLMFNTFDPERLQRRSAPGAVPSACPSFKRRWTEMASSRLPSALPVGKPS